MIPVWEGLKGLKKVRSYPVADSCALILPHHKERERERSRGVQCIDPPPSFHLYLSLHGVGWQCISSVGYIAASRYL